MNRLCGLFAGIIVLLLTCVGGGAAQSADAGAVIAGQSSPWQNAHFVLIAYGAIWGILVLYIIRLRNMIQTLKKDLDTLSEQV